MKENKIQRVGLTANFEKTSSRSGVRRAAALIARSGHEVLADARTAEMAALKCKNFPDAETLAREADLLLVFGGDGTMLRVAREINGAHTPVLGINAGRLGFLTAISSTDLPRALQKIWKNDFVIEPRPLIEARGHCAGKKLSVSALNEIVISHGAVSRLVELDVSVNGELITRYRGDGLIVSSPTGSTAYSLSAGGPIVSPRADVFAITPICAHALSNRSVIVSLSSKVEIKLVSENVETIVSADGQVQANLNPGDSITIQRSRRTVELLHLGGSSFFETVREKLHWRGSYV